MSVRVVERVDDWNQRQFAGGYDALRDLADREFSGVVRAGGAELLLTAGTVVDVRRGTIEAVEDASGTVYEAPHPALPLLAVMQEADVDVRAQYYTEKTPLSEVEQTLSGGGFTGFVELSENVLSGDYFVVYHGGTSQSVAYVGESERLLTDDEAFETADDEVGIYKVRQVDVEPVEIPEPTAPASGKAGAGAASDDAPGSADGGAGSEQVNDDTGGSEADADSSGTDAPGANARSESTAAEVSEDETDASTGAGDGTAVDDSRQDGPGPKHATEDRQEPTDATEPTDSTTSTDATPAETDRSATSATDDAADVDAQSGDRAAGSETRTDATDRGQDRSENPGRTSTADSRDGPGQSGRTNDEADGTGTTAGTDRQSRGGASSPASPSGAQASGGQTGDSTAGGRGGSGGRSQRPTQGGGAGTDRNTRSDPGQAGDLETKSVPSLDPDQTEIPSRDDGRSVGGSPTPHSGADHGGQADRGGTSGGTGSSQSQHSEASADHQTAPTADRQTPPAEATSGDDQDTDGTSAVAASELAELEDEIDRLETELAEATGDRDDLQAEVESLRQERDELAEDVEHLETELERLEDQFGAATDSDRRMTPAEAIEGTNLFVDYDSKGNATLEKAHGGSDGREGLAENLQLGIHTEFDEASVSVGSQAFGEFLPSTLHYRFAHWVVRDLLFEIRDTGQADALGDLYDALPEIRRVEFNGVVDVEYVEDGQEKAGREQFDVIFRHRMGDALLVANLNDSREPATGGMMDSLVTAAERVGQTEDTLAAAFLVTSSYFESGALETVSEATRSGLLSRDSRDSFVNLSRKSGYHLCLTAAREGNFHMEVPEL